ncbi:MAG: undecaprenyl-diphosphate phosphatase [Verrucomicrobiales bacterium]|jgi:undecaprenyl-diphosphatase|nr:undecaprenyl-diphosphate phosphatase [Verrucomicrobiales bacterium]
MREWINTIVFGAVEGLTEFLPISSTGHLIVSENLLGDTRPEFFLVGIQAGAVLAIVLIYWRKLAEMTLHLLRPANRDYALKLTTALVITGTLAFAAKRAGFTLPESAAPVAWATLIGALVIFGAEYALRQRQPRETIGWTTAAVIGLAQVVAAIFPGTSRSGATIIAAMWCGTSRSAAAEFSFLLSIPTMFAATGYSLLGLYHERGAGVHDEMGHFAVGFAVSTLTAFLVVKWLLGYIRAHSFIPFAWYRLALGLGLLAWLYTR